MASLCTKISRMNLNGLVGVLKVELTISCLISLAIVEAVRKLFTAENIFPSNVTSMFYKVPFEKKNSEVTWS